MKYAKITIIIFSIATASCSKKSKEEITIIGKWRAIDLVDGKAKASADELKDILLEFKSNGEFIFTMGKNESKEKYEIKNNLLITTRPEKIDTLKIYKLTSSTLTLTDIRNPEESYMELEKEE